jgi:hypothetical protein
MCRSDGWPALLQRISAGGRISGMWRQTRDRYRVNRIVGTELPGE